MKCIIAFLLVSLLTVYAKPVNYCYWPHKCVKETTCQLAVSNDTLTSTRTWPDLPNNTFSDFSNFSIASPATTDISVSNVLKVTAIFKNVSSNPCGETNCWMRVRPQTDPIGFTIEALQGYYDLTDGVLSFFLTLIYDLDSHDTDINYFVTLETCIINSIWNHCRMDDDKVSGYQKHSQWQTHYVPIKSCKNGDCGQR
jgi:hypothetical protein